MKCHSHRSSSSSLPALTDRLRRKSRKLTGARQAVLEVLRCHAHPMTIKEIFAEMPPGDCDLATVYRCMHLLEETSIVQRFDFGDGAARFELWVEGQDGHHHHLVCTRCSGIIEIEECFMREVEEKIASRNGFKGVTHKLEFFGICPACQ
jgi:Fur family ferric uptake transcriptional regulator